MNPPNDGRPPVRARLDVRDASKPWEYLLSVVQSFLPREWQRLLFAAGVVMAGSGAISSFPILQYIGILAAVTPLVYRAVLRAVFILHSRHTLIRIAGQYATNRLLSTCVVMDGADAIWLVLVQSGRTTDYYNSAQQPLHIVGLRKSRRAVEFAFSVDQPGYDINNVVRGGDYGLVAGAVVHRGRALAYWLSPSMGSGVWSCRVCFSPLDEPSIVQSYRIVTIREVARPAPTLELDSDETIHAGLIDRAHTLLQRTLFADQKRAPLSERTQAWVQRCGRRPRFATIPDEWFPMSELGGSPIDEGVSFKGRDILRTFKGPLIERDPGSARYRILFVPSDQYQWVKQVVALGDLVLFAGEDGSYVYDANAIMLVDGRVYEQDGSWYVERMSAEGQPVVEPFLLPAIPLRLPS